MSKASVSKMGIKNPNWKGEEAGLKAIHEWVRRRKAKPEFCEECHVKIMFEDKRMLELKNKNVDYCFNGGVYFDLR